MKELLNEAIENSKAINEETSQLIARIDALLVGGGLDE